MVLQVPAGVALKEEALDGAFAEAATLPGDIAKDAGAAHAKELAMSRDPCAREGRQGGHGEEFLALAAEVTEVTEGGEQSAGDLCGHLGAPSPIREPLHRTPPEEAQHVVDGDRGARTAIGVDVYGEVREKWLGVGRKVEVKGERRVPWNAGAFEDRDRAPQVGGSTANEARNERAHDYIASSASATVPERVPCDKIIDAVATVAPEQEQGAHVREERAALLKPSRVGRKRGHRWHRHFREEHGRRKRPGPVGDKLARESRARGDVSVGWGFG